MLLRADSSKTWTEMGKGRDPQPLSRHLQARHISPTETGFLRSLTCSQLHFVRHAFLTLPREKSGHCRSRLRQTTHPCWRSAGPVKAQSWRLGRLGSVHSPTQTGVLFQESRKWCYCELVLTLCHSEFSVLKQKVLSRGALERRSVFASLYITMLLLSYRAFQGRSAIPVVGWAWWGQGRGLILLGGRLTDAKGCWFFS